LPELVANLKFKTSNDFLWRSEYKLRICGMIKSEKDYKAALERIEELLAISENIEDPDAKDYLELNQLADLVADYEKNTWFRDELIESEESGQSSKTMDEKLEEARKGKLSTI
jgi:hypothetical protein